MPSSMPHSLGLDERARFKLGDWAVDLHGQFELILCNPPYVEAGASLPRDVAEWEPYRALFADTDGLSEYRRIAPALPRLLAEGASPASKSARVNNPQSPISHP